MFVIYDSNIILSTKYWDILCSFGCSFLNQRMKLGIRQHMILVLASITLPETHKLIAKIDPSPITHLQDSRINPLYQSHPQPQT